MTILTVDVHRWLTFPQLIHIYSVGQMAPGPNIMMIVVIGQWAVGISVPSLSSSHSSVAQRY
jgi:chromate transporter